MIPTIMVTTMAGKMGQPHLTTRRAQVTPDRYTPAPPLKARADVPEEKKAPDKPDEEDYRGLF